MMHILHDSFGEYLNDILKKIAEITGRWTVKDNTHQEISDE